jgi:hypothetical protein
VSRRLYALRHFAGLSIVLGPLLACIAAGSVHATLWLDEILYWYYERNPGLRAIENMRPGSRVAPLFMNYFYCDIQRVAHSVLRLFGLTLGADPELYLRFLSIVSFAAGAVIVYVLTSRESRSWWWSVAAGLVVSASPLLLFYAFEARVSAFATLGVIVDLALLACALRSTASFRLRIAGAIFGIFLGHLHVWIVCLFAGLCVAAIVRFVISRNRQELWTVAAFALPGAIIASTEAELIMLTNPPSGHSFPLYLPQAFGLLWHRMLAGSFSVARAAPPAILKPVFHGASIPLLVLLVAVVLVAIDLRRSPLVVIPLSAALALPISLLVGANFGHLIIPRYLVPLVGALLFSLTFAMSRRARVCVALLAVIEIVLLPSNAITLIAAKGNGKQLATVIETQAPREKTAVVVQQSIRLGYPDPLHNFVLHFYLDELHPGAPPIRLLELPSLRDITSIEGVREYFGGGPELAERYTSTPTAEWEGWLKAAPFDRIWFVVPVPTVQAEEDQFEAFTATLAKSGYTLDRAHVFVAPGYPRTQVGLFVRLDRNDPATVSQIPLKRVSDVGAVHKAGDENGVRPAGQR